jgi:hypothetical protein
MGTLGTYHWGDVRGVAVPYSRRDAMKSSEPFRGKFPDFPGKGNIFEWVIEQAWLLRKKQEPVPVPAPSLGRRL